MDTKEEEEEKTPTAGAIVKVAPVATTEAIAIFSALAGNFTESVNCMNRMLSKFAQDNGINIPIKDPGSGTSGTTFDGDGSPDTRRPDKNPYDPNWFTIVERRGKNPSVP